MRWIIGLCCLCLGWPMAWAQMTLTLLETDPPAGAVLHAGEALWARIGYENSDRPLRLRVAAYWRGEEQARATTNPAPPYPAGSGEAIAWIAYDQATAIDELRLQAFDEAWQLLQEQTYALPLSWSGRRMPQRRQPAAWVIPLNEAQQQAVTDRARAQSDERTGWGWSLLLMLMGWSVPGYLFLQIWLLRRKAAVSRRAALLPLFGMVPLGLYTLFALLAGSNLWPLMLILLTPLAFVYLLGLWLFSALWRRRGATDSAA